MQNLIHFFWLPVLNLAIAEPTLKPQIKSSKYQREVREVITPKSIKAEQGMAYIATLRLQREADKHGNSKCVLLEDGKPIGPSRALHRDIRELGLGRYSHWTPKSLYFSASDSSDPRTNGRKYELVSLQQYISRRVSCEAKPGLCRLVIQTSEDAKIRPVRLKWKNASDQTLIPTLRRKGWPDLTSTEGILQSIIRNGMTDEEKAIAIWKFLVDWRYHYYPAEGGQEVHDPVKFINVYGYGFCDDSAANFSVLCRKAGIKSRSYALDGHVVAEAFFENAWHMFDPDHQVYYRREDGVIASSADLEKTPALITHVKKPLTEATKFAYSPGMAKLYTTSENNRPFTLPMTNSGRLEFPLAPGDNLEFNSSGGEAVHSRLFKDQPLPPVFGNGTHTRHYADLKSLQVQNGGRVLEVRCPYVILDTLIQFQINQKRMPQVHISLTGEKWSPLKVNLNRNKVTASARRWLSQRDACYGFKILVDSGNSSSADSIQALSVVTKFQFAPRALPQVTTGKNEFVIFIKPDKAAHMAKPLSLELEWEEILNEKQP